MSELNDLIHVHLVECMTHSVIKYEPLWLRYQFLIYIYIYISNPYLVHHIIWNIKKGTKEVAMWTTSGILCSFHKIDNVDKSFYGHIILFCKEWSIWGGKGVKEIENKMQMIIRYPIKHVLTFSLDSAINCLFLKLYWEIFQTYKKS